jgi:hypothetical protein
LPLKPDALPLKQHAKKHAHQHKHPIAGQPDQRPNKLQNNNAK